MVRSGRNVTLDMVKWIAACMVVFIHVPFPGIFGEIIENAARFAVPFFFTVSGYFAYMNDTNALKRKAKYIFCLYLGAVLLYFVYQLVIIAKYDMGTTLKEFLLSYANVRVWGTLILLNYSRTPGHLWFLLALVYCYGLEWLRQKCRITEKTVYILSCILIAVHLLLGEVIHMFDTFVPHFLIRNFLLMGYPFFALGMLVRRREEQVQKISSGILIVCMVIGTAEAVTARLMFGTCEMYIGSVLASFSVFFLALKGKGKRYPAWTIAVFSTNLFLYIFHIMAESLLGWGMQFLGINLATDVWEWTRPVLTCVVTVAFALVYQRYKTKRAKPKNGK